MMRQVDMKPEYVPDSREKLVELLGYLVAVYWKKKEAKEKLSPSDVHDNQLDSDMIDENAGKALRWIERDRA